MKFLFYKSFVKINEAKKFYSFNLHRYFNKEIRKKFESSSVICPHCKSVNIIKFGYFSTDIQRYRCKDCRKTFNATTNSVLSYTKKKIEKWLEYMNCMNNKLSLRKTAAELKISIKTAFYWRHKILKVLNEKLPEDMDGIIEIKTTYINESFKGKRYPDSYQRDLGVGMQINDFHDISDKRICVLCCQDRNGNIFSKTLCRGPISYRKVDEILKERVLNNCEICTDNNMAYESFARKNNIKLHKVRYMSQIIDGKYHIKNASRIESYLKRLVSQCRGVCTRFLNFYIAWVKWSEGEKYVNKGVIDVLKMVIISRIKFRNKDLNMVGELGQ
ncbi:IS1595 family transposase [Clostridium oryzae]|uniref:ISXO2-like transposase domain-containing protein n=1 Tax=Clostridium oryzae TaxID=1450648 RepID=A0A1V4IQQ9_9CLOT|nr:IS1595 family transposase [Clostridium oryzae]OPJ62135.1 hypothetical protein CLORY_19580 [Clostridium oryzae]